ncbi:SpoIVB peptidase [Halalkalibacillus sediminis]|uniref:SpoIVB peptidase n=1 Tax=Halalkalibacillus sediminis TaxID=2018042 RepID=A0A2I0QX71_9BACI|nr:SpoIVB peptidase [Halalkalibacillus sediminis]PKR78946.1 SpoIVB peptidase [Halalkalibacillus sediminis]
MKQYLPFIKIILLVSFLIPSLTAGYIIAAETVSEIVPGGQSIGVKLHTAGVVVVGFSKTKTDDGETSAAKEAGIEVGDLILRLNDAEIKDMSQFTSEIKKLEANDEKVKLLVKRSEQIFPVSVTPVHDQEENKFRLGLFIRDATSGIGTMTFYDPETKKYGALGHMITDHQTRQPVDIYNGKIVSSDITSIDKGRSGAPGEKKGEFSLSDQSIGTIQRNSDFGIFGKLQRADTIFEGKINSMPVARANEVKEGKAKILTVVKDAEVEEYEIEIISSVPSRTPETKGMIIKVTDPKLLKETGGIVQGMSGSPIIQNDKIIGAVTHVFLNDPTSGYGVHVEWMLNETGLTIERDNEKLNKAG